MRSLLLACVIVLAPGCVNAPTVPMFLDVIANAPVDPLAAPPGGAAVLIFISTDCPIANGYAPQLQVMMTSLENRSVKFSLVHIDPDLTPEAARKHAAEFGYHGTIVLDKAHLLVEHAGATITPEAAVFDSDGKLQYRGRINNWYGDIGRKRPEPTKHELRDAIEAVLSKRPVPVARTEAVGCSIEPLGR